MFGGFEKVWLTNVIITFLHQILGELNMDQKLENTIVLVYNGELVDHYFNRPLAIINNFDTLQEVARPGMLLALSLEPSCTSAWSIFYLYIHISFNISHIQISKRMPTQYLSKAFLKVAVDKIELISHCALMIDRLVNLIKEATEEFLHGYSLQEVDIMLK